MLILHIDRILNLLPQHPNLQSAPHQGLLQQLRQQSLGEDLQYRLREEQQT